MKPLFKYPTWLLCAITISITLFSCQKNADDTLPESSKISSKDPQTLSAAISVWHGKRTTGTMPVSSNTAAIKLGTPDESSINAIAGQHAFIHTNVETGDVAGYYVQINGASEYFKVDYAKPVVQSSTQQGNISTNSVRQIGHSNTSTNHHRSPISVMGGDDNNNDSLIVINIPVDIKTPDTVCVTYMAYDFNNHVSNPVSVCIYIDHFGGDNDSKWLEATWSPTKVERIDNGQVKGSFAYTYNKWLVDEETALFDLYYVPNKVYRSGDSAIVSYYNGYSVYTSDLNWYDVAGTYNPHPTDVLLGTDSIIYRKNNITFNSSKYTSEYSSTSKNINWGFQLIYQEYKDEFTESGSWSYDSKKQKLIIISEYANSGNGATLDPYITAASIVKISDTQIKLSYEDQASDGKTYTYTVTCQRQ